MTPRQKCIVVILAIVNVTAILALVALVTRSSGARPTPLPHSPTPIHPHTLTPTYPHSPTPTFPQGTCQWRVTQLLAEAKLGGTVALTPDGPLRFEIAYHLAPGQATPENTNESVDEAAQSVWTAFDVALALQERGDECATFTQVEVTILARSNQTETQISANVSAADLAAFSAGELSEDEFIERVTYKVIREP